MKNKLVVMLMLWSVCWGQAFAAEEKSPLPLPDSGNVTLTLDEYNKLMELAAKPPKKNDLPPLPYSIKHADLKLRVENDGVLGTVQLEGEVFRKGVSKVPCATCTARKDAPPCPDCGAIMIRSGACYKCLNCGAVSGCS